MGGWDIASTFGKKRRDLGLDEKHEGPEKSRCVMKVWGKEEGKDNLQEEKRVGTSMEMIVA